MSGDGRTPERGGRRDEARAPGDPLFDPELDRTPQPAGDPAVEPEVLRAIDAVAAPFDPTGPALPSEAKVYAGPKTLRPNRQKTVEMLKVRIADEVNPRRAMTERIPKLEVDTALEVAAPAQAVVPDAGRWRKAMLVLGGGATAALAAGIWLGWCGAPRPDATVAIEPNATATSSAGAPATPASSPLPAVGSAAPPVASAVDAQRSPSRPAAKTERAKPARPAPPGSAAPVPAVAAPTIPTPPASGAPPSAEAPSPPAPAASTPQTSWF